MTDIFKKQYVISKKPLKNLSMVEYPICQNYFLYVDERLSFQKIIDKANRTIYLIGNAFSVEENRDSAQILADFSGTEQEFLEILNYFGGRFLIVFENTIWRDACGLMGAFYIKTEENFLISSSVAVLCQMAEGGTIQKVSPYEMSWQLLPYTTAENVRSAFCTQKIRLFPQSPEFEDYMWFEDKRALSTTEKAQELAKMLPIALSNIQSKGACCLALTSGKDSRLVLAALMSTDTDFSVYTLAHDNITRGDQSIPKRIAKDHHLPYSYVKKGKLSKEKLSEYDQFVAFSANGADRSFYAHGQFDKLEKGTFLIRSGIFEAAQTYARRIVRGSSKEDLILGLQSYYKDSFQNPRQREGFEQWIAYIDENSCDFVDLRDRFYIEQRVGGWVAAIEASMDLNDFVSLQIANCPALISILLSATQEERARLALSYEPIKILQPQVLSYPINPTSVWDKVKLVRNKIKKVCYTRMHKRSIEK